MKSTLLLIRNLAIKSLLFCLVLILHQGTLFAQEFHGSVYPPAYKGGNIALKEFIDKNLVVPDSVKNADISGTVTVSLLINKEGKIENLKLLRGIQRTGR